MLSRFKFNVLMVTQPPPAVGAAGQGTPSRSSVVGYPAPVRPSKVSDPNIVAVAATVAAAGVLTLPFCSNPLRSTLDMRQCSLLAVM